jgi:hypothetical protein
MMKMSSCWPVAGTTTKPFSQPLLLQRSLLKRTSNSCMCKSSLARRRDGESHAEFLRGPAIRETIERLRTEAVTRTASARRHFEQFCDVNKIVVSDQPLGCAASANWREEMGDAERRLMFSAGHHDLVVLGRRT